MSNDARFCRTNCWIALCHIQTESESYFRIVKVNKKRRRFCTMLFIFFVTKTLKSCWLKICTSQNAATFEALVPAPTGKQWVSPWKAATAQYFGSFSSFISLGIKDLFRLFLQPEGADFKNIWTFLLHWHSPFWWQSVLSTTIGFQWTFLQNCNQQIG